LRNPMICSSLYLLVLMSVILQVDGLRCLYGGMAGRGQVMLGVVAALLMTAGLALAIGPLDPLAANAAARCA
jgi:hypothetical protein